MVTCGRRTIQNVVSKVGSKTLSSVEGTLWLKDTSEGSLELGMVHSFLCSFLSRKGEKDGKMESQFFPEIYLMLKFAVLGTGKEYNSSPESTLLGTELYLPKDTLKS